MTTKPTVASRSFWFSILLLMAFGTNLSSLRNHATTTTISFEKTTQTIPATNSSIKVDVNDDDNSLHHHVVEVSNHQHHFKEILDSMGINYSHVPDSLLSGAWSRAQEMYYHDDESQSPNNNHDDSNSPVILGLERCQEFRRLAGTKAKVGMAGLFNSGTNALARNLILNIGIPNNTDPAYETRDRFGQNGILSEVPWWKHNPLVDKYRNATSEPHTILPIVLVRDPLFWRKSTKSNQYSIRCNGGRRRCDFFNSTLIYNIQFNSGYNSVEKLYYKSLEEIWNDFHSTYLNATFPRLLIRFEDTLFYLPQLIQKIADCVGAYYQQEDLIVQSDYAKTHGQDHRTSSLLKIMLKASNQERRMAGITPDQMNRIKSDLDPELLKIFRYRVP